MFINNTDNINAMDKVAFYCTVYQFLEQVVTSKLVTVSQTQRQVCTYLCFVFILVRAENAISHRQVVTKSNETLVAFCESNVYSSAILNQIDARPF